MYLFSNLPPFCMIRTKLKYIQLVAAKLYTLIIWFIIYPYPDRQLSHPITIYSKPCLKPLFSLGRVM